MTQEQMRNVAEVEDRIDFKINRQMGRIKEREAKRDVC